MSVSTVTQRCRMASVLPPLSVGTSRNTRKLQVILALASMNAVDAYMHKNGAKLVIDDKNGAAAPVSPGCAVRLCMDFCAQYLTVSSKTNASLRREG